MGPGLITGPGLINTGGVVLINVNNSEVSGITMRESSEGIFASNCNFLTITRNTIGRNVAFGIVLDASASSTISENDVSGNGDGFTNGDGLDILGPSSADVVSHNIVNGNNGSAVFITGAATVRNNVVSGNGQNGIFVAFGNLSPVEIVNNRSLANGMFDLFDGVPGCSGHVWSGNTFFTANQSCIH